MTAAAGTATPGRPDARRPDPGGAAGADPPVDPSGETGPAADRAAGPGAPPVTAPETVPGTAPETVSGTVPGTEPRRHRPAGRLGSSLLGGSRLAVYGLFTLALMPLQALAVALRLPLRTALPRWYHGVCLKILGFDVTVRGTLSADRPTLFVSNHSSYLDITVLGALIPGSFVAKREVGTWPFFGWLAKLQRTVFVDRRPGAARDQRSAIERRLAEGDLLILFPEGTSSDGNRVLPFKSALFAAAELGPGGRPVTVQPVTVACTALDGIPLGRWLRPAYAWYGDMDLMTHMWQMVRLGRMGLVVEFHPPVDPGAFASRKDLARHCRDAVADGMSRALSGRDRATEPTA